MDWKCTHVFGDQVFLTEERKEHGSEILPQRPAFNFPPFLPLPLGTEFWKQTMPKG